MARARNAGADWALARDAELLIFLDVDCVPDAALIGRYIDAHRRAGPALLAGPVTYLPPSPGGYDLAALPTMVAPHRGMSRIYSQRLRDRHPSMMPRLSCLADILTMRSPFATRPQGQ